MQQSLSQEVGRIEKLQPFYNDVWAALKRAQGQQ